MAARPRSVLQIGCGSFGPTHLEAWHRLGLRGSLWVELDPEFLDHVQRGTRPEADVRRAGVDIAVLYEAIMRSAQQGRPVRLEESVRTA